MRKKTAAIMVVITPVVGCKCSRISESTAINGWCRSPQRKRPDIVDAYMEAYAKGNSYSVEYAHFEDEFVRQAYLSVEDQLISYQIEHIEKVNDNLYALTIKMKTTQTVMLRGDVWSEVYNFVARIDGQWKFINGVGNIPDDLQENLEKEKIQLP